MRKEIIIRMYVNSEKCQTKAMKVAATVSGVESVTLAGGDKSLLLVIGNGVDSSKLTKKLKKKVGAAEIVELRTLDTFQAALIPPGAAGGKEQAAAMVSARSPVPYHHWQHQYAAAPSPYGAYDDHHHHLYSSSPMAARGYGSRYSHVVARSHPANYSPLVEKHDYHPMDDHRSSSGTIGYHSYRAVPRRRESGSHGCCIL